jgi:hypothetical protein
MDIVDPMGLRDLLKRIDHEAEKIAEAVRQKYRALAKSRHALAKQFEQMTGDERIQFIAGNREFDTP